jgi:hypothetical protein
MMSTVEKKVEEIFSDINKLNKQELEELAKRLKNVKDLVIHIIEDDEDKVYYGYLNESLKEVWDNEEDDIYNEL